MGARGLVALLLAAAVAAGGPGVAATGADPAYAPVDVLVVGDSLAVGMRDALTTDLAPLTSYWDVKAGRTTPRQLRRLAHVVAVHLPRIVVVSLGTNDGSSGQRFHQRITRVLDTLPVGSCVIWPDISRPPRKGPFAPLNRALRREAQRHPQLTIVPWRHAVASRTVVMRDGVHPTAAGYLTRASMVVRAIRRSCR